MIDVKKSMPTLEEAYEILEEAEKVNPGLWIGHCKKVAEAAKLIAEKCEGLDPEVAYIFGLLHDIGNGSEQRGTTIGHILGGYDFCMDRGYEAVARICITHSCPSKSIFDIYEADENFTSESHEMVKRYLNSIQYDEYDRLIQLSDALGLAQGFTLVEKRLLDVSVRHGINDYIVPKWKAFLELKDYFNEKIGGSIYSLLPGVVENTFEF